MANLQLPGNLLVPADADFESALTGDWTTTNCTVAQSATHAFTGTDSLQITCTLTGTVSVQIGAPYLAAAAANGYVLSAYAWTASSGVTAQAGASWYKPGPVLISTVLGTAQALTVSAWTPFTAALASPALTTLISPVIQFNGMTTSEVVWLDLVYAAPSLCQALIAWGTAPLSTSPQFADMTPFTRADQPITIDRGRPDEISVVQAGNASLTLDNNLIAGMFSQGNTSSPFSPNVVLSKRMQVNFADETGAWHTRFDGTITDLAPAWAGGPGLESMVTVSAQGLIGWLARNPGPTLSVFRTLLEEEMQVDAPMVLYSLADKAGSTRAADESGNAAAPLNKIITGSAATLTFGSGAGIVGFNTQGFTTSVLPSPAWVQSGTGMAFLAGALPSQVTAVAGFTAECWYHAAASFPSVGGMFAIATGTGMQVGIYASGTTNYDIYYKGPNSGLGVNSVTGFTAPATGQMVLTVSGTTATVYVNGVSTATLTIPSTFAGAALFVGGPSGPNTAIASWNGSLNCAAVYPAVLSGARITAHYNAGSSQGQGQLINTLIANTLAYAGIPAAFYNVPASGGVSYSDAFDATGQTPLSMIQQEYQLADGGVFYEAANGQLTWQDRAARYGNQVTPALTLSSGQAANSLTYPSTTQFLVNDTTDANGNIPAGVRAINAGSVTANGTYPGGTPASPTTAPWLSYPYQPNLLTANHDVLTDAANWQVNIYGTPVPRSPSVTVDLATSTGSGTAPSRATVFGVDVGSVIQLTGLPSSAPAGTRVAFLMAEGVTESFQRDESGLAWTITFNTSPASQSAAWIAGDANLGILDSTAVVGLGTDGTKQAGVEYVGPPYPVPTFAAGMNRTGNVGANDMRGLSENTRYSIYPPVFMVQQVTAAQSISNNVATDVQWDTVWYDQGPMGPAWGIVSGGNATTCTVRMPGVYLLMACINLPATGTGNRFGWFQQNGAVVDAKVEVIPHTPDSTGLPVTAQIVAAAGDLLKVTVQQSSGGAQVLGTNNGGCVFGAVWLGV